MRRIGLNLIFDEATSALDYESERIVTENMKDICKGRTAIVIAHRPSTLELATRVVRIEKGALAVQDEGAQGQVVG